MALITPDEIKALKRPLPLDKHTLREGHKEGGKIRWFVYVDRSAVQDLLDELFPGEWETQEPKMYPVETRTVKDTGEVELSHEMSATMGITIRGLTRWDGGESDDGSTKSAITNAFRRTAAYGWGIARYLYDMDIRIKTDTYSSKGSDGRWQTDWKKYDQMKQQAWDMFVQWYNLEFGPSVVTKNAPQSRQEAPSSDLQQQTASVVVDTPTAAETAKAKLGTPSGQSVTGYAIGTFKTRVLKDFYNGNTKAMNADLQPMFDAGLLPPTLSLEQAIEVVRSRKSVGVAS